MAKKYVETYSSSDAVAQNPEERVQMKISRKRDNFKYVEELIYYASCKLRNLLVRDAFKVVRLELAMSSFLFLSFLCGPP